MEFNVGNAQHIGSRQQQQDSFAFSDPSDRVGVRHRGFLGIVADGMGGLSHGQQASATAVQTFLAAYEAKLPAEPIPDALLRSLLAANRAVVEMPVTGPANDAGTTLVAAVVTHEHLYWVSAGDSRIYWLHDQQLTRLTADHVYATLLNRDVVRGKLSRAAAENHPEHAALTSFLGQPEPALIDRNLRPLALKENEYIILCSDGFYRAVTEEEILAHFNGDPQTACDELVACALARQRNQQDNLTVIAFRAKAGDAARFPLSPLARAGVLALACLVVAFAALGYWFRGSFFPPAKPSTATPPAASTTAPASTAPAPPVTVSVPPVSVAPVPPETSAPAGVPATSHTPAVRHHRTRSTGTATHTQPATPAATPPPAQPSPPEARPVTPPTTDAPTPPPGSSSEGGPLKPFFGLDGEHHQDGMELASWKCPPLKPKNGLNGPPSDGAPEAWLNRQKEALACLL